MIGLSQRHNDRRWRSRRAMTFMEVLIVVGLIGLMGLGVSNALINGLKVWDRSKRSLIEEDIAIFFDKFRVDLHNSYIYSKFKFEGFEHKFSFPAVVNTRVDRNLGLDQDVRVEQLGKVEYFYDFLTKTIRRRQANYSQSFVESYDKGQELATSIDRVKFKYFYITENEEIYSADILDVIPSGVEVEVEFSDRLGHRVITKYIDIPVGS